MLDLDLNQVEDPEKLNTGGRAKPGRCHAVLVEFEEYGESNTGSHIARWEILAHDDPSQVGKFHRELLSDPGNQQKEEYAATATKRLLNYCYVLGLCSPADIKAAKAGGPKPNVDISSAVGRQAFLELVPDKTDKYVNVGEFGFAVYSVNSPEAKDFPRNAAMASRAAKSQPTPAGNSNAAQAQPQTTQTAADPFAKAV